MLVGEYLGERDAHGFCTVRIDGRRKRLRLNDQADIAIGDQVVMRIDAAINQRLAEHNIN